MPYFNISDHYISPGAYLFVHGYLNTMQKGIQASHVLAEIFMHKTPDARYYLEKWASLEKTIYIRDAGTGNKFKQNYKKFSSFVEQLGLNGIDLPFSHFREPDIEDIMTGFGFIITDEIIGRLWDNAESLFIDLKNSTKLAQ